jgi:hypothetical protein
MKTDASRLILVLALLGTPAACGEDNPVGLSGDAVDYQSAVETITLSEVRGHVGVLAHDSMLGRWSPSAQIETAARYIESEFAGAGLRPGTPTGYLQWFQIGNAQVLSGAAPVGNVVPGNPGGSGASPNVVGWIEGSDPALRDEHVVFTAHFDHIGTSPVASPSGDYIYNGADDSGPDRDRGGVRCPGGAAGAQHRVRRDERRGTRPPRGTALRFQPDHPSVFGAGQHQPGHDRA